MPHHWCKGITVIYASTLGKSLSNQPCLVPLDILVLITLDFQHPFALEQFTLCGFSTSSYSSISQTAHLLVHCFLPKHCIRPLQCTLKTCLRVLIASHPCVGILRHFGVLILAGCSLFGASLGSAFLLATFPGVAPCSPSSPPPSFFP
jgi:hypothetical protein